MLPRDDIAMMMPLIFADYYCHDDAFLYLPPADAAFSLPFSFIFRFRYYFALILPYDDYALLID